MFNAWDFVFALLLLLSCVLGWKLKSLTLLGAGFAFALAPLAAEAWKEPLAQFLGCQSSYAWWLLLVAASALLLSLFFSMSKMLATLKLEGLDRGFGALLCAGIFLAALSLNLGRLSAKLGAPRRKALVMSWSWKNLRISKEPAWVADLEEKIESIKLPKNTRP